MTTTIADAILDAVIADIVEAEPPYKYCLICESAMSRTVTRDVCRTCAARGERN